MHTAPAWLRHRSCATRHRHDPERGEQAGAPLAGDPPSGIDTELVVLDRELARLTLEAAPKLCDLTGVGPDVAGALLVAAGDNPERLRSDAAFASLCGVSPVPASSGKTNRHRLNRGGDRIANNALWRIVMVRLTCDQRTKTYVARRTAEGMAKRDIVRCLKRYVAREVFHALLATAPALTRSSA